MRCVPPAAGGRATERPLSSTTAASTAGSTTAARSTRMVRCVPIIFPCHARSYHSSTPSHCVDHPLRSWLEADTELNLTISDAPTDAGPAVHVGVMSCMRVDAWTARKYRRMHASSMPSRPAAIELQDPDLVCVRSCKCARPTHSFIIRLGPIKYITIERLTPEWRSAGALGRRDASETHDR